GCCAGSITLCGYAALGEALPHRDSQPNTCGNAAPAAAISWRQSTPPSSPFGRLLIDAFEVGSVISTPRPLPMSDRWVGAKRARERLAVRMTRRDDPGRWSALLHPSLERRYYVIVGTGCSTRRSGASATVGSDAARTVTHARHHKQPVKVGHRRRFAMSGPIPRQKLRHFFVVIDRAERWNRRVAPAVVLNQLASAVSEGSEIGIVRVQYR